MVPRVTRGLGAFVKCPSVVFDRRGHNSENHRVLGLEGAGPGIWEETEAEWEGTCLPQVAFQPLAGMLFVTLRDSPKERVELGVGGSLSWTGSGTPIFMEHLAGGKNQK